MMKFLESTYTKGSKEVKYVLEEGKHNKNFLVIIFSGFASADAKPPYKYNYIRTLRQLDCHKLFILDKDGPRGSYYLGENLTFDFEKSVYSLIEHTLRQFNIKRENVITAGTSKGGSAALYYGLKYKMGYIIAGAPQTKIANYVLSIKDDTAKHMLGDMNNKDNIVKLNKLIYEQLESNNSTKITILGSENDWQHRQHIIPFVEKLKEKSHPHKLIIDNNIKNHSGIAQAFPNFFVSKLLDLFYSIKLNQINLKIIRGKIYIESHTDLPNRYLEQINIYNADGELLTEEDISNKIKLDFKNNHPIIVKVAYAIKYNGNTIFEKPLDELVVNVNNKICVPKINVRGSKLHFKLNIKTKIKLKYAFYLYKDGKNIEKIMYQTKQDLIYDVKTPGEYYIKYFILLPNEEKIVNRSQNVTVS